MPASIERLRAPVECVVEVDGREMQSLYPYLREVRVEMSRKGASTCTLSFDSVRDTGGKWVVQDAGILAAWKRIKIDAVFGSRREEVMRGYIKEVKVEYPADMSAAMVTVLGQDETILFDREHKRATWSTQQRPVSDQTVVQAIAQAHQLLAQAAAGLNNQNLAQDGTAIKFLQDRADANGYELYTREGILHFEPPSLSGQSLPTILVYAGDATNCLSFSARYDGHKPDRVRVVRAQESGAGSEEAVLSPNMTVLGRQAANSDGMGLSDFVWNMQQAQGGTTAEAQSRAQAKANENAWKVVAEGELDGALYGHVLLTYRTVSVDGVGEVYGGLYYVDEVKHVFSNDGYRQQFKLLRNAVGEQAALSAADPLAAVRG